MTKPENCLISIIVPVFNESAGLASFHVSLVASLKSIDNIDYEIIYCDDGSRDDTSEIIQELHSNNNNVRLITLSRNFGKEYALTAGINQAKGDAIVIVDGDGQHPVELIGRFVSAWRDGAQVVIGVRKDSRHRVKSWRSKLFYKLFNGITGETLLAGSTDFRLIDAEVQRAFIGLTETDRITRGLIDWLGFRREIIEFKANDRQFGTASYTTKQLVRLAVNSFVSLSPVPLYIFGFVGVIITIFSSLLGGSILIEQMLLRDPLGWRFTGTAMLSILVLFLVGIILISQGILSLYISHIHNQSKNRPLYVINHKHSIGINKK